MLACCCLLIQRPLKLGFESRFMSPVDADGPLGVPVSNGKVDLSPDRCAVLVPFQGRIVGQCQSALLELEKRGYTVRRVEGYSAIDQARNQIASDALADGFQETLWVDSDVGFVPNDVERIRRHGLPVVCGIYPKKGKRELAIHILPGTPGLRFGINGGLHELLYGGTGFLHIRRSVYDMMIDRLGLPVCNEHAKRPMWPFFLPMVRTAPLLKAASTSSMENTTEIAPPLDNKKGHWYLAEDFAFCHRARLCGIPIIADTSVRLWHIGDYAYSWEDAGIDRDRFSDFDFQFSG